MDDRDITKLKWNYVLREATALASRSGIRFSRRFRCKPCQRKVLGQILNFDDLFNHFVFLGEVSPGIVKKT